MIYLVHHGDAIGPNIDPMRPLSERGRTAVLLVADEAARRGTKPEAIWHSGKLRARQTAEAFWMVCRSSAPLSAQRGLQPSDPPEWMRDRLVGETRNLMLVGHMPNLGRLFQLMIGDRADTPTASFPLHGMIALEVDGDRWREAWRISP